MTELLITGPDALKLLSYLASNDPDNFTPNRASQLLMCNEEGYYVADGILFCYSENEYNYVGIDLGVNWIEYQAEKGGYDVKLARSDRSPGYPNGRAFERPSYRLQIQGPKAVQLIEKLTGEPFPKLKFFHMTQTRIAGLHVNALRHGMVGAPGLEIWGPYEEREEIRSAIIEAGREFRLHLSGSRAYFTNAQESGWVSVVVPAVYSSESTREFREWLSSDSTEALLSIEGSYYSKNIEDYYVTPHDLDYGHILKLDHDFIGKKALEKQRPATRRKVTLAWNAEDTGKILTEMMKPDSDRVKPLDLPIMNLSQHTQRPYDTLLKNSRMVGVSLTASYSSNELAILSLAMVDKDIEIGDELVLLWGEAGSHSDVPVEPDKLMEIRATVSPTPYARVAREEYRK
jgi:vanillate/3-O-methylgallate O-demethylase